MEYQPQFSAPAQLRVLDIRNVEEPSTSGQLDYSTMMQKIIPQHRVKKFHKLLSEPVVRYRNVVMAC